MPPMKKILTGIVLLIVVACGSDPPKSGEVVNKEYTAAHDYTTMVCISWGQYGCLVYIPMNNHEPQHWKLKIRDDSNGKERWVEVLQEQFNRYSIGNHWPDYR